jgi:hypothetical protein
MTPKKVFLLAAAILECPKARLQLEVSSFSRRRLKLLFFVFEVVPSIPQSAIQTAVFRRISPYFTSATPTKCDSNFSFLCFKLCQAFVRLPQSAIQTRPCQNRVEPKPTPNA